MPKTIISTNQIAQKTTINVLSKNGAIIVGLALTPRDTVVIDADASRWSPLSVAQELVESADPF